MSVNFVAAGIAGLAGTTSMTTLMLLGQRLGLPAIDVHGILGHITQAERRSSIGYIVHWVFGVLFAIPYFMLFHAISGDAILLGAAFGIVHWLLVGGLFALAPVAHAGMQAGTVKVPGTYMMRSLGTMGFIAGMVGHVVFGMTVALIYRWLA